MSRRKTNVPVEKPLSQVGDVCAVNIQLPGAWPAWYLARIIAMDDDAITSFRIIGELSERTACIELLTIRGDEVQDKAQKLANSQWVAVAYANKEDLKAAILAA